MNMNKHRLLYPFLIMGVLIMTVSCKSTISESQYSELDLKSLGEFTNKKREYYYQGGIYIPAKTSPKDRLPVVFMTDGLLFKEDGYKHLMDSLIENKCIRPVVVVCSYEDRRAIPESEFTFRDIEYVQEYTRPLDSDVSLLRIYVAHHFFFSEPFIPFIEHNYPISTSVKDRIYFGTSLAADYGITLSIDKQGLFDEYWCFSPTHANLEGQGILEEETNYRICWSAKAETIMFDYYPKLLKDIRKRGGNVHSWVFNNPTERDGWKYWFQEELKRRFPYK